MRAGFITTATSQLELLHHTAVREIRKEHSHALVPILLGAGQMIILIAGFYAMSRIMNMGSTGLRGDLMIFLVTGVFLFQVHVKAMASVLGTELKDSGPMRHGPMSAPVAIAAAVLGSLYIQTVAAAIVLSLYHFIWSSVSIQYPFFLAMTYLLSWVSGVAIGLVLLALRPRAPSIVGIAAQIYSRVNMIASGQFFVANALPAHILVWLTWNPLFHIIDQARGYAFLNYVPWNSSIVFPAVFAVALLVLGTIAAHAGRDTPR